MSSTDQKFKDSLLGSNQSQDSFELSPIGSVTGLSSSSPSSSNLQPPTRFYSNDDGGNFFMKFYREKITPNLGLCLVILAQFFNSMMNMSCKLLETDPDFEEPMNPFQILFVRMSATCALSVLYMYVTKVPESPLGPRDLRKWLMLRGFTGFFGVFGVYYSLQYLSVSDATVLIFLSPTITGVLAWIVLKERFTIIEAIGGLASLIGVVLIARPTFLFGDRITSSNDSVETSDPLKRDIAVMVLLLGAFGAGSVVVVIRFIGKRLHALISVSYYSLWCCIVSFIAIMVVPSYSFQLPHTSRQWFYFLIIGFSGFIMQFSLTTGIQLEKAGRTSLMTYTQMIWALLWEVTIWHHLPPLLSWLGFTIIIGSAISIIYFKPKDVVNRVETDIELSNRV